MALSDVMSAKRMREMEAEISRLKYELKQSKEAEESCRVQVGLLNGESCMPTTEECLVLSYPKLRENLCQMNDIAFANSLSALLQCSLPKGASTDEWHKIAKLMPLFSIGMKDMCCEDLEQPIPAQLITEEACELKEKLMEAGMIDENWQTINLSGSECALLAKKISEKLSIWDTWQIFGKLWDKNPHTLRSLLYRSQEQRKSLDFQDRLKEVI